MEDEPIRIGLLDIPRLPSPPQEPFLRGVLTPIVLLVMAVVLVPRLILVATLLVVRFFMVAAYKSYAGVPAPISCLTAIPALFIYFVLGLLRTVLQVLLEWNLVVSGMDEIARLYYVSWIIGPVIGTQD